MRIGFSMAFPVAVALWMLPLSGCGSDESSPAVGSSSSGTGGSGGQGGSGGGGGGQGGHQGGQGGAGGSGGSAGRCAPLGDPCSTCASTACEDLYCSCTDEPQCMALVGCLGACPQVDEACVQRCSTAHEAGISPGFLLNDCGANSCATECPGSKPATPCQLCLFKSCPEDMNRCLANPECSALIRCVAACPAGDMGCPTACGLAHAAGIADARPVGMCNDTLCQADCQ